MGGVPAPPRLGPWVPAPPRLGAESLREAQTRVCVSFSMHRTPTHGVTVPGSLGAVLEIEERAGMHEVHGVALRRPGRGKSWTLGGGGVEDG